MDLLDPKVPLDLADPSWKIYSRNPGMPPQYLSATAEVQNSSITEGCVIEGKVESSVIFAGVTVEEGAEIVQSILMPGSVVRKGAKVQYAILAEDVEVCEDAVVGEAPEEIDDLSRWGVAVVASGIKVGKGGKVLAKGMIEADVNDGEEVTANA